MKVLVKDKVTLRNHIQDLLGLGQLVKEEIHFLEAIDRGAQIVTSSIVGYVI